MAMVGHGGHSGLGGHGGLGIYGTVGTDGFIVSLLEGKLVMVGSAYLHLVFVAFGDGGHGGEGTKGVNRVHEVPLGAHWACLTERRA